MASGGGTSGNGNGSDRAWISSTSDERRSGPVHLAHHDRIRVGPLVIDPPARRIVHDDGREQMLEPRMMQVLVALLRADGIILSRDDLIDCCWEGRIVSDEAISSVIYRVRRAVKEVADGVFRIETIAKVGFRLVRDAGGAKETQSAPPPARTRIGSIWHGGARWAVGALAIAGVASLGVVAGSDSRSDPPSAAVADVEVAEPTPSLAVMPFADLSPGRDNAYFAEGMAEAIMGLLSEQPDLRVIGQTSIGMLGEGAGISEARTRLGVTHVLEGSVRRSGQALRVNVRLIDARDGRQLWAEQFDRSLGEVFAIQDDIGAQVLSRLRGTLAMRGGPPATFRTSPEVYDLYLAAIALERDEMRPSSLRARELLERAIRLDSNYAPAFARLASYGRDMWVPGGPRRGPNSGNTGPIGVRTTAFAHARRALALAPNLGDAHAAMGILVEGERNWAQSIPHLQRAVDLDPGNFLAWDMLGHVQQFHLCRFADAAASFRRASAIEPLIAGPQFSLALIMAEMGRFDDAVALTRRFASLSQDRTHLPKFRSMISTLSGDLSSAVVAAREAISLDPDNWSMRFGHAQDLRALGDLDGAVRSFPQYGRPIAVPLLRGDYRTAAAAALQAGTRIWRSGPGYRSLAMAALVRAGRYDWLLQSFDSDYASVEVFDQQHGCRLGLFFSPHLIDALRHRGRHRDAARLLQLTNARFAEWAAAGHRGPMREVLRARLLALAGRRDAALAALEEAARMGWLDQYWPFFSLSDPLFDPLRADARFDGIERRIAAGVRRERAELTAHQKTGGPGRASPTPPRNPRSARAPRSPAGRP